MLLAIGIGTQVEQQGLFVSHARRVVERVTGEIDLHRRRDTLNKWRAVEPSWKRPAYFSAHPLDAPRFLSVLGGRSALPSRLQPHIRVNHLAVEIGVGQHYRFASVGKPRGRWIADLGSRSRDLVVPDATKRTVDPYRLRSRMSISAAAMVVFAHDDAGAAQRTC